MGLIVAQADLLKNPRIDQQRQRAIDGRLGHAFAGLVQQREQLLGVKVYR